MDVLIRKYQEQDFESCRQLWFELTQRHRDIYFDQSIGGADPGLAFEHYLKKTSLEGIWGAEQRNHIIAMAGLLMDGDETQIEPIVVLSGFRSQGIGTMLIERLKAEAKTRGATYLSVKPVARNIEAVQCFHRAGFSLLGHMDMFIDLSDGDDQGWVDGVIIHGCTFRY
jgi:GNAT superfamily N-acetyltransferase